MVQSWRQNWTELVMFFRYSPALRQIMYATNLIEGCNRQRRKVTKSKMQFLNDQALVKILYLANREATRKWAARIQNWGEILGPLAVYCDDRVTGPLEKQT